MLLQNEMPGPGANLGPGNKKTSYLNNSKPYGSSQGDILDIALQLIENGFSVMFANRDKTPRGKWQRYQKSPMTAAEAKRAYTPGLLLAVIGGAVSGNLEFLDFDDSSLHEPFVELLNMQIPGMAAAIPREKSPNGFHWQYRCTEPVEGNKKLAARPIIAANGKPAEKTLIETRSEGGYCIVAPSEGYQTLEGPLKLPILTPEEVKIIHDTAAMLDERQQNSRDGDLPGQEFNRANTVESILLAQGWKKGRRTTAGQGMTRPRKEEGVSAVILDRTGNVYNGRAMPHHWNQGAVMTPLHCTRCTSTAATSQQQPGSLRGMDTERGQRGQRGHYGELASDVREFVEQANGPFQNNDLFSHLCINTRENKKAASKVLYRLEKEGKINKIDGKYGWWKPVIEAPEPMDLLAAQADPVNIPLPLGISDVSKIRRGNVLLFSGAPNAGKTTVFLATIHKIITSTHIINNICVENSKIRYQNSEMSADEILGRISQFSSPVDSWIKHVDFLPRSRDFSDLILPDGINFIDYLDVNEDFFLAGKFISEVHHKLNNGIAIIAMQKKPGADFAKGGYMTLEKPRLVVNLDHDTKKGTSTCRLMKAKEPADYRKKYAGMEKEFAIDFEPELKIRELSDWRYPEEQKPKRGRY